MKKSSRNLPAFARRLSVPAEQRSKPRYFSVLVRKSGVFFFDNFLPLFAFLTLSLEPSLALPLAPGIVQCRRFVVPGIG
jgi:hypothetical protein